MEEDKDMTLTDALAINLTHLTSLEIRTQDFETWLRAKRLVERHAEQTIIKHRKEQE